MSTTTDRDPLDVPGYNSPGARLLRAVTAGNPPIPAVEAAPATVTTGPAADPERIADADALVAALTADTSPAVDTVRALATGPLTLTPDPARVLLSGRWFTVTDDHGNVLGRVVRFPVDPDTFTESYGAFTGPYAADALTGPAAALAFILEYTTGGAS